MPHLDDPAKLAEDPSANVEHDLLALSVACDEVAARLQVCAAHVNEGRLQPERMMLVMHQLAARLTGPGLAT